MPTETVEYTVPFSYAETTGDGMQVNFAVPFPFIDRLHVGLFADGTPITFTWINDGLVQATVAPDQDTRVRVRRLTPAESMLVIFSSPANFRPEQVNFAFNQLLFIIQEAFDSSLQALELAREVANTHAAVLAVLDQVENILAENEAIQADMLVILATMQGLLSQVQAIWETATWDIAINIPYRVGRSEIVASYQFDEEAILLQNAQGSRAWALSPGPSIGATIHLEHNSVDHQTVTPIADITFAPNAIVGVFGAFIDVTFAPGETLVIRMGNVSLVDEEFRHWGLMLRTRRFPLPLP